MDLAEVSKFETKVGVIKLSEALRRGAKLRKQCWGVLYDGNRSCALGAIYEGTFGKPAPLNLAMPPCELLAVYPMLRDPSIPGWRVYNDIMNRNDVEHHTREEIADWLETRGL